MRGTPAPAKSILDAGAKAIATSSWAVAEAQGYRDGEAIPIRLVEQIIARIVSTIDAPVSIDFEGGLQRRQWGAGRKRGPPPGTRYHRDQFRRPRCSGRRVLSNRPA